jgi:hypothetical protein
VAAAPTPQEAVSVNKVHGVYYVTVQERQTGWVQFTPGRDGEHALLLANLELVAFVDVADIAVPTRTLGAPDGCAVFDNGEAVTVKEGATYSIALRAVGSPGILYFEHLPSFGDEAWSCDEED